MENIYFTNTLTRNKDKFIPNNKGKVGIYSCGPTVYWNQHIGHMYAYVQWDVLVRFLRFVGFDVTWVMNITDVGHMTSDEDWGVDKMEKGAKREGLSVWELAEKYITQFKESLKLLNVTSPDLLPRATEHIKDQIKLAEKIESKGYAYKTHMGLVFDTSKFPNYTKFANLKLEKQIARSDVEVDPEKKNPSDFFLWVTGNKKHIMQWDSPWGKGYPGWHLECTAMSTKYLGENFDIHTGGVDHIPVHHTDEIAQGFTAYGKQTANYWLHNAHLLGASGDKMSKSLGNFITVGDLVKEGYDPQALRYLILNSHYRKGLNFSFEGLDSSQKALKKLKTQVLSFRNHKERGYLSEEKLEKVEDYRSKFISALSDDLNAPQALAILWEVIKSNIPSQDKYDLAVSFDEVLGLNLNQKSNIKNPPAGRAGQISKDIKNLVNEREDLRKSGKFKEADEIRRKIFRLGFTIKDTSSGPKIDKI